MQGINGHKAGYKHTTLGWIPEDWEVKKLSECIIAKGDYGINAAAVDYSTELPAYLRITDIDDDGNFCRDKKKSVADINYEQFILQDGDIVFVRTGATVGKTYLYDRSDGQLVFAGFLIRFKTDSQILLPYYLKLYTLTKPYWDWVKTTCTRSGQPGINSTEYGQFKLPVPKQFEQHKIVKVISTWDEAIQRMQQLIVQIKRRNKGLMQQLMSGTIRLKGFKEKWKDLKLANVTTKISRRNGDLVDAKVYSVTNSNGFVLQSEHFEREIAGADLSNYKIIKKHEFAYNPARINVGSIAYFTEEIGIISSLYVCFKTNSNLLDMYLRYLLDLGHTKHKIESLGEGGVRIYLWYDLFAQIRIALPPIEEQEAIMKILVSADNELKLYEKHLANLQQLKKGLMQKLLSGEVRVKV